MSWCSTCPPDAESELDFLPLTPQGDGGFIKTLAASPAVGVQSAAAAARWRQAPLSPEPAPLTPPRTAAVPSGQRRYRLQREVLGGGATGIVEVALDEETQQSVAVKRVQCNKDCPVRFLSFILGGDEVFTAEGFAGVHGCASPWSGPMAFDPLNEYGEQPFAPGSVEGCLLILRRGGVSFEMKARHAHHGGAVGVLMVNWAEEVEEYTTGSAELLLPSVMLTRADGEEAMGLVASAKADVCLPARVLRCEVCAEAQHEVLVSRKFPPHPHVVKVLDAWFDGDAAVVVTEFCAGGRPAGCGDLPTALRFIRHMLAGIAHLHAHGICHRDIKPENLLLTQPLHHPAWRLVLLDFSMASTARRMVVPCGSPRYLAPEVLSGSYGLARDVWSAGVVAHELLFGQHPFGPLPDRKVLACLAAGRAPSLEAPSPGRLGAALPESVRDLLRSLLEVDPRKRPSAAQALEHQCFKEVLQPE